MDDSPLYSLVLFIIFIIINGLLYAFGEAVRMLNESDVEKNAEYGNKKYIKIKKIIDRPDKFISTVHMVTCVTVALVGFFQLGAYGSKCQNFFVNHIGAYVTDTFIGVLSYLLVAVYLLFLIISLGILVPKRLGAKYAEGCAKALIGLVWFIMTILTPFTAITTLFANIVIRIFGIDPKEELLNVTEEEIISMVNEGHEQGVLEEREAEMISNIMELDEKTAGDVMIHRKHIIAVDGMWTLEEAVEFIINQNYSRFPVYIDDIDNIIGILHLRDAMSYYHRAQNKNILVKDMKNMLMTAVFIPESRNVDDLFKDMQKNKTHMEIVVDEYGQTSGIIAMEDILEEIVGNIWDEYDVEEENITVQSDGSYLVKGLTTLEEMEDVFEDEFDNEDYDTLNGFLISKLERIPDEGEKTTLVIDGYMYQILAVKDRMISLVRITKVENDEEDSEKTAEKEENAK